MQHNPVLNKLNFDLLTHHQDGDTRGGGSLRGKIFATMLLLLSFALF